ncbi:hypothetical protein BpHYR1_052973 [Brachionus plicatilis]|uniref:Uncharacterized protein n=1 Tax=Brachionus plicatilis TaxID=10195 RepID=A0A3M7RVL4_BRAPC|nr:hypothetical protein BpHYR1_052973 [Brachionus plicatilis]
MSFSSYSRASILFFSILVEPIFHVLTKFCAPFLFRFVQLPLHQLVLTRFLELKFQPLVDVNICGELFSQLFEQGLRSRSIRSLNLYSESLCRISVSGKIKLLNFNFFLNTSEIINQILKEKKFEFIPNNRFRI